MGFSCFFEKMTSLQAELKALIYGIRLVIGRGYSDLHLESDSLVLVQIGHGKLWCPWRLQGDLQELLKDRRSFRVVTHCFRERSELADRLANIGVESRITVTYESFSDLPRLVRGDVALHRSGLPSLRRVRV